MQYEKDLPTDIKNLDLVLLTDWNSYFRYPTEGSLRQMIFHNKYEIQSAVVKIGGRVYIKLSEFKKLLESSRMNSDKFT